MAPAFPSHGQNVYWQQEVNYKIDVVLDDVMHTLTGHETIEYINHSPDTLYYVWFHLWPNAYKNTNTALYKQLVKLNDRSDKMRKMAFRGYIDSLLFTVNNVSAKSEPHPEFIDVIKLMLPEKLLPGQRISIATPFFVRIPMYLSRLGHDNGMYMISQWYPKPAVYDSKGWHAIPYLDQGEFYSEFGSFLVSITVPSAFVVAATGSLLTGEELRNYKEIGRKNQGGNARADPAVYHARNGSLHKTVQYAGDNIHDFAWFADKDFIIHYDTLLLKSGRIIDVFSFRQPDGNKAWKNSLGFIEDAVGCYSRWVGEYPYTVVNAVEGPANSSSGGMEYPMITLITSPGSRNEYLDAVITHEVGHNWFYGVLGTNERDHAWMDEGINSYYQFRYEAEKYKANSIFGDELPAAIKQKSTGEFLNLIYRAFTTMSLDTPVETPSSTFSTGDDYALTVYVKAAMWMYILEQYIGRPKLEEAMQAFFREWQFKHPYPEDLKASIEKSAGKNLDNIFNLLARKGALN
ncbi:MAG: M1 family metallopeptidase [Chitinophagaceae bacterium]